MDIILISHQGRQTRRLSIMPRSLRLWVPLILLPTMLLMAGFWLGCTLGPGDSQKATVLAQAHVWNDKITQQRNQIADLRQRLDDNIQALTLRLGHLQADVTRIDAAGARMTQVAGLEKGEFDFDKPSPIGGPETDTRAPAATLGEFRSELDQLANQLDTRRQQLHVLRDMMIAGQLHKEVTPSGWPINKGWISSRYGKRIDPFTGKMGFHPGIDFAATRGSKVHAVASGVVVFAGKRGGYGNLVILDHGNGYTTRYGHNEKILVKVGQRVAQGQTISLVGSTGYSTGPHVHFEVWRNGRRLNPASFIQASR